VLEIQQLESRKSSAFIEAALLLAMRARRRRPQSRLRIWRRASVM